MGRSSDARERLLDSAAQLILRRGYADIGVAEICASADVRKGSFYHFFESKQALTIEVIGEYWDCQRAGWNSILGGESPALQRIENLFRAQAEGQRVSKAESGFVDGCLLGNLALELSNQDAVVAARLGEIFDEQIKLLEEVLTEAADEGEIPATSTGSTKARALLAQLEGSVMFAKLANDPSLLDDLWANTSLLLKTGSAVN